MDTAGWILLSGILFVLTTASVIGAVLSYRVNGDAAIATVRNLNARVRAWWVMVLVFGVALWMGIGATVALFALISFLALREVVTLTPTRKGDHHTLFYVFFVAVPLHFWLIYLGRYGLWSILIPVYGFVLVAVRSTFAGDYTRFMERVAKIFFAMMICIYCLGHAPALMTLQSPVYDGLRWKLLTFLVVVVQMSDVLQYVWGKMLGKHKIAPNISPSKTWEGFVGGTLSATLIGWAMCWFTPYNWWQAPLVALLICVTGFFGGIVMSAIKRDAGVKDYGQLIEGHGGMTDRIDSLIFSAPIFFHVTRYWFGA